MSTQECPAPVAAERSVLLGGRYTLGPVIGSGGMAEVFLGRDLVLDRSVAVKVIRVEPGPEVVPTPVESEVRLLAGLQHPGLVTLFDAGTDSYEDQPCHYLVMELVNGQNLAEVLRGRTLSSPEAADLGGQLADALGYVHAQGIAHGDVKPANILISRPVGDPFAICAKIADFGVARLLDADPVAGLIVGTANYVSPEQATANGDVGTATDIYSLGLTLIEALTGHLVYPGSGIDTARARLRRPPVVPQYLGQSWCALLTAMTSFDPAERPTASRVRSNLIAIRPTTTDVAAVIRPTATLPAATSVIPPGLHRRVRPRRRRVAEGVAVLVSVLAIGGLLLSRSAGSSVPGVGQVGSTSPAPAVAPAVVDIATTPVPASTIPARPHGPKPKSNGHGNR